MPIFYLNLFNSSGPVLDDEGYDFPNLEAACQAAVRDVRSIIADEVSQGRMDLRGRIDVVDQTGAVCATIRFADALTLTLPEGPQ